MDEILLRLATFALLPVSVAVAVNATRLAKLGFYYCSLTQAFICFRCRQTFNIGDELSGLNSHNQMCSAQAAPIATANTPHQSRYGCGDDFTATSEVTNHSSSCPPGHRNVTLISGHNQSHDQTCGGNVNANMSPEYSTMPGSRLARRHQPNFERLKDETVRLSTFHDWPERAASIVEPRDLAKAGMFYTGQIDRVQCAFCRGYLRNWMQGDKPAEEHRRHFPDCPFVRQLKDSDNAAAAAATTTSERESEPRPQSAGESNHNLHQSFQVGLC